MMQAGCRRHHFPWEEGLFLPLGTKYTVLPNIFMEPHLITAMPGRLALHADASSSAFALQESCTFHSIFGTLKCRVCLLCFSYTFIIHRRKASLRLTHPLLRVYIVASIAPTGKSAVIRIMLQATAQLWLSWDKLYGRNNCREGETNQEQHGMKNKRSGRSSEPCHPTHWQFALLMLIVDR